MSIRLILASSSPYRRDLLARLGLPFEVASPDVDERPLPGESPQALVERLAVAKARAVGRHARDALVVGSDQAAVYAGAIVGKPGNHETAVQQLRAASGRKVVLYT